MEINEKGLNIIKEFEGCRLKTYKDIKGILTIGYGHTGEDVKPGMEITQEQAEALLKEDLQNFEDGVTDLLEVDVNTNQFSALVSLAYNIGLGNLQTSRLLKYVNDSKFQEAASQFLRWDRSGGIEEPGLLRRREAERQLFLSP